MAFTPRKWQKECLERFREKIAEGETSFIFEACMGAGKSAMAAILAKAFLTEYDVDHVLVLVPWQSIQGDNEKGMLGAFGKDMGLDSRSDFFTTARRQPRQPRPRMDATVTTYQQVCCQEAIETLKMWMADGFKFALMCDEIHHTNEINSSWGDYVTELQELALYSVFMSGTYFRGDRKPISCIPRDEDDRPVRHYQFPYAQGVKENVVRPVTTREINATIRLYDKAKDYRYELSLDEITGGKELAEAKKQVLDPNSECVRQIIQTAHEALMQTRTKFEDAACLFVCRPGGGDNYTRENDGGAKALEDKYVHLIARQIQSLTGEKPTVVTHHDKDAVGKISAFRRAKDPYLVAVNMVSEGCDIPRIRAVAFCRYTTSEMLFRQIVGRALRMHTSEDGTAAQVYIPAFRELVDFAASLYREAQEGVVNRRCADCGGWPCECPCGDCGRHPCECPPLPLFKLEPTLVAIEASPFLDGGHVGQDGVKEHYVVRAMKITQTNPAHQHLNHTQLGHILQQFAAELQQETPRQGPQINPGLEREKLGRQINRHVRRLGFNVYKQDYAEAWRQEVERPFGEKWSVISNTWTVDQIRQVADRLEKRIIEEFRNG